MKKILFTLFLVFSALHMSAYDFLRPVKDSIPNGYNRRLKEVVLPLE